MNILNDEELAKLLGIGEFTTKATETTLVAIAESVEQAVINKLKEGVEPVGHYFCDDPKVFAMPGGGYIPGPIPPENTLYYTPLYLHPDPQVAELRVELLSAHCQYEEWTKERVELTRQRDELLNALTYVIEDLELRASLKCDEDERGVVDIGNGAYERAKRAIASVKGGAK